MTGLSSFLIALCLTGVLATVCQLFLPRHLSGLGRILRVLCASLALLIVLAPLTTFLMGMDTALEELASLFSPDAVVTAGGKEGANCDEAVFEAAKDNLVAAVKASLASSYPDLENPDVRAEYCTNETGINAYRLRIYLNHKDEDAIDEVRTFTKETFGLTTVVEVSETGG